MMKPFRLAILLALITSPAVAQKWVPADIHSRYRAGHGMATDPTDGRPMVFGGAGVWFANRYYDPDTWGWNGSAWYRHDTQITPPADDAAVLATDIARRRVVLVSVSSSPVVTWEWDGMAWNQRSTPIAPPTGTPLEVAMTYDLQRGRCVLFYGSTSQTWEWDGNSWSQVATANSPSPRFGARMANDYGRGRSVLFGGDDGSRQHNVYQDTWEYDGTDWYQIATNGAPSGRNEYALAFDPLHAGVVLYGGRNNQVLFNDTWTYDGTSWTAQIPAATPPSQVEPQMAYDEVDQELLLFTGHDTGAGAVPETWKWNGTDWTQRIVPASPPVRVLHGLCDDDHGRIMLFGGLNAAFSGLGGPGFADTWLFDGSHWQQSLQAVSPSARGAFCMSTDTTRHRVVLFGGALNGAWLGDTWEWDGSQWAAVSATGPAARSGAAMTFDAARGVCVLHGGEDANQLYGDTWEWNGSAWQSRVTPTAPSPRADHAMTFDGQRHLTFLYGGRAGVAPGTPQNDLWQWNGTQWSLVAATTPPVARSLHSFTYDPDRARFVLHGSDSTNDTWEWDGNATWTPITAGYTVPTVSSTSTTWDPMLRRILSWDGGSMWAYSGNTASGLSHGSGCGTPTPRLAAEGRAFLGNSEFGMAVQDAAGGSLAFLCVSFFPGNQSLPGGCTVLLQNPITLSLTPVVNTGLAHFGLDLPANVAFQGVDFFFQAATVDPLFGLSLTNSVEVVLST